ncbi:MAG: hypothetical protein ABS960_00555 [Solibacillus isronensis]
MRYDIRGKSTNGVALIAFLTSAGFWIFTTIMLLSEGILLTIVGSVIALLVLFLPLALLLKALRIDKIDVKSNAK